MRGFFVQKFCAKLFCAYILDLNFFGARILAQMRSLNVGEIDHRVLVLFYPFVPKSFTKRENQFLRMFCALITSGPD
jgi:hypothetical protein